MGFFGGGGSSITNTAANSRVAVSDGTNLNGGSDAANIEVDPGAETVNVTADPTTGVINLNASSVLMNGDAVCTNSAPVNTIPVTVDGDGNLEDSKVTSDGAANPTIGLVTNANGNVNLNVVGAGGQLAINAADGDASHVGGELTLTSGGSAGQSGGQITIEAGSDDGGGDGGGIDIHSGAATQVGGGGASGEINIRAGGSSISDGDGGRVRIMGGSALDGDGGGVIIQAGPSTNGDSGFTTIMSGNGNSYLDIGDTTLDIVFPQVGFTASTSINLGTPQIQVNATVTPAATVGAQTINKSAGSVNFAATATSLVVTNSTVSASSIILCTVATNDATATIKNCVAGVGSFTITLTAAATAECRVNFWVLTPQ